MLGTRTMTAGVGVSTTLDAIRAGAEAAALAVREIKDGSCDFVLVFGGMGYDTDLLLDGVRSVTGTAPLVGCSTQGVVARRWASENPRVVGVMAIDAGPVSLTYGMWDGLGQDSYAVGRKISSHLLKSPPGEPVMLLCLYDPLTGVNVDQLLRGLESVQPIPIVGGAASQPWGQILETRQYCEREIAQDAAVCVLISGDVRTEFGVSHGAVPLGVEMTITKATGHVVSEIDGRPAYGVWKELVGAGEHLCVEDIASWAIGIRLPEGLAGEYEGCVTRSVFKVDRENESIYLQSEIAEGTRVMFHHRTFEAVVKRALRMAERLGERIGQAQPCFALSFECGARSGPFLGHQAALEEIRGVQSAIGADVPWLGMYAWGEIAPMGGVNYFHNYTFPVCVLVSGE